MTTKGKKWWDGLVLGDDSIGTVLTNVLSILRNNNRICGSITLYFVFFSIRCMRGGRLMYRWSVESVADQLDDNERKNWDWLLKLMTRYVRMPFRYQIAYNVLLNPFPVSLIRFLVDWCRIGVEVPQPSIGWRRKENLRQSGEADVSLKKKCRCWMNVRKKVRRLTWTDESSVTVLTNGLLIPNSIQSVAQSLPCPPGRQLIYRLSSNVACCWMMTKGKK
jgi:hypothetical protein